MLRRVTQILLCLLISCSADAAAQIRYVDDDTLLFHFDQPVVLTANRVPTELLQAPASTQILHKRDLDPLPALTVGDALRYAAGSVLHEYGAQGLQLAGFRGLGAEYTLVYLNGVRLNDAQNSTVDLGLLSLSGTEQIEIVRGGHAALYGSSALGGIVNIHAGSGSTAPTLTIGAGSFGWRAARGTAGILFGASRVRISGGYEEAENDFEFSSTQRPGEQLSRHNASSRKSYASLGGVTAFSRSTLSIYTDWVHSDIGTPGAYTGSRQGQARQGDQRLLAVAGFRAETGEAGTLIAGVDLRLSRQNYSDPGYIINGIPLNSEYVNTHAALTASWDGRPHPAIRVNSGLEVSADRLVSDEVTGSPDRLSAAAFSNADWELGSVHVFPALRFDTHRDDDPARMFSSWSPSLGVRWDAIEKLLALRIRGGKDYSNPTFNQLYWKQGGNPDLRTERSIAFDAGIELRPSPWLELVDITFFHHDITDKIIWLPAESVYWTPANIQHVVSNGVEAVLTVRAGDGLQLRLHGQWISSQKVNESFPGDATSGKQLIYVPTLSGGAVFTAEITHWLYLTATEQAVGERYITRSNDRTLPAYALTDLAAVCKFELGSLSLLLKPEALNIFNASYEIAALYPMPGRHFRISLTTEF